MWLAQDARHKQFAQHARCGRRVRWISEFFLVAGAACAAALGMLAAMSWPAHAQSHRTASGSMSGVVLSAKGAPVPGAQIIWQTSDGGIPHLLHADAQGRFHIARLRSGLYDLRADNRKSWSEWEHNALVRPGGEAKVTLRLVLTVPPAVAPVALKGAVHESPVPVAATMPNAIAADAQGELWVTLGGNDQIARFNPRTRVWNYFAPPTPNAGLAGIAVDADGIVWFAEHGAGKLGRLDPHSGRFAEYKPPTATDISAIAAAADGSIWMTAPASGLLVRMDPANARLQEFTTPTQDAHPDAIIAGKDGGVWFCESGTNRIARAEPATGVVTEFAAPEAEARPSQLAAVNGAIYFTDFASGRLGRLSLADEKFQLWPSPSGPTSQPAAIGADAAGKIWYTESNASRLVRFDPATQKFSAFVLPYDYADARAMARDSRGRLWIAVPHANKLADIE